MKINVRVSVDLVMGPFDRDDHTLSRRIEVTDDPRYFAHATSSLLANITEEIRKRIEAGHGQLPDSAVIEALTKGHPGS